MILWCCILRGFLSSVNKTFSNLSKKKKIPSSHKAFQKLVSTLQTVLFYPLFNSFLNLSIHTNYWAKVLEWITLYYLLSFNSHNSFSFLSIATEVAIIYSIFVRLILKPLDSKASYCLSSKVSIFISAQ